MVQILFGSVLSFAIVWLLLPFFFFSSHVLFCSWCLVFSCSLAVYFVSFHHHLQSNPINLGHLTQFMHAIRRFNLIWLVISLLFFFVISCSLVHFHFHFCNHNLWIVCHYSYTIYIKYVRQSMWLCDAVCFGWLWRFEKWDSYRSKCKWNNCIFQRENSFNI